MSEYSGKDSHRAQAPLVGPNAITVPNKVELTREDIISMVDHWRDVYGDPPEDLTCYDTTWPRGPKLNRQNLSGLNLNRLDLRGIDLSLSDLRNIIFSVCDLRGTSLFGSDLSGSQFWSARLQGSNLRQTYFDEESKLNYAHLEDADLSYARLEGTSLYGAYFDDRSRLYQTYLDKVDLTEADLEAVDLRQVARLRWLRVYLAKLDRTQFYAYQLEDAIGEEVQCKYLQAARAYRVLKANFQQLGQYSDASWSYRKERRMEKLAALEKAKEAWQKHDWKEAILCYAKVAGDQLVEWVCDYGESVPRVLGSLLVIYVLFTLVYGLTWSVIRVHATATAIIREPTRNLVDLARFSLGAMTTMDLAGLEPRNGLVELLAGLEALLGIALTGLLGFVVGNRIRRS